MASIKAISKVSAHQDHNILVSDVSYQREAVQVKIFERGWIKFQPYHSDMIVEAVAQMDDTNIQLQAVWLANLITGVGIDSNILVEVNHLRGVCAAIEQHVCVRGDGLTREQLIEYKLLLIQLKELYINIEF